jgi:hypothetical protein
VTVSVRIQCGDLDWIGDARNYKAAFRKAVREQKPESLAPLYRFRFVKKVSDRPIYTSVYFYADAFAHLPKSMKGVQS